MHPWLAVEEKEVLKWIFIKSVEHRRQVTLTSIWQQGDDGLSGILRTLGDEGGTIGSGTGGDSYQQTVFLGELSSRADGIVIVNVQYLVNDTGIIGFGYETGSDALYLVGTALSTVQDGGGGWLHGDDLYVGILLFQVFADTGDSTARTYTSYEDVNLAVGVSPYLRTGGRIVLGGVGGVLKLLQDDGTGNTITQLLGGTDGTCHTVLATGQAYLSTVCLDKVATLHTHRLGHRQDELVTLDGGDEGESYASITAGGFDDGGSWFQQSFLLCVLYHGEGDTVFHTTARVEKLYFGDDRCLQSFRCRVVVQFEQGSSPNKLGQLFCNLCHNISMLKLQFFNPLNLLKRLLEVINDVIDMLRANTEANG